MAHNVRSSKSAPTKPHDSCACRTEKLLRDLLDHPHLRGTPASPSPWTRKVMWPTAVSVSCPSGGLKNLSKANRPRKCRRLSTASAGSAPGCTPRPPARQWTVVPRPRCRPPAGASGIDARSCPRSMTSTRISFGSPWTLSWAPAPLISRNVLEIVEAVLERPPR